MNQPAWFGEILRSAAHVAFTSAFWDTIDRERSELEEGQADTLPAYGAGYELVGYTDRIDAADLDLIANTFNAHLVRYHGVSFWQLCEFVFELDDVRPRGDEDNRCTDWYGVYDAVGSEFLGMLGHGVCFWDDLIPEAHEKAEEKFPRLADDVIYYGFDQWADPESLLDALVEKHRKAISQNLPTGDSLRRRPRQPR